MTDAQTALAQVREALADPALFDEGASVDDTFRAADNFGAACSPENVAAILAHVEAQEAEIERLRAVLGRIAEGCSFPADDVQRAIRDTARDTLKEQR